MFTRLVVVVRRSPTHRIVDCSRVHRLVSSSANKKPEKELQSSIDEHKDECDSGDYLGVSGDHVDGNFGPEEILASETKEDLSRKFGLGKYTASNAYDGQFMVTNFGEIKIDPVRKGVIPTKRDFSKLKPKLGFISDSLVNYRDKVDAKISPLPLSELLGHKLKQHEDLSGVSDESIVQMNKQDHINEESKSYSTDKFHTNEKFLASSCSDQVNKPTVEKTKHNKPLLALTPKPIETNQDLLMSDEGTELVQTLSNVDLFVSEARTQIPDIIKGHQETKRRHKMNEESVLVDDKEENSLKGSGTMGKRNFKDSDTLIMEVVSEKEMSSVSKHRNRLSKTKTDTKVTQRQSEPSKTQFAGHKCVHEDYSGGISLKHEKSSSHGKENLLDSSLSKEKIVYHKEIKRDFVEGISSDNDMKLKTPYAGDGAINCIQDTQNLFVEVVGEKEMNILPKSNSMQHNTRREKSSHNLEKVLDPSPNEDRFVYQDDMKDDFSEEVSSSEDVKSVTPYVENAAFNYFQDLLRKDQDKKIDKTSEVDLSKFVPRNVYMLTEEEVVNELMESILYNRDGILAINKIYGIPSQGGEGVRFNIADLLPKLAERINCEQLHMVHRLDKETTGVMLFGKTEEMAKKLRKAFRQREVKKTYLVITKGIPKLKEGIINVPIAEGEVGKDQRRRMTCIPLYNSETKHIMHKSKKKAMLAVTHYKVVANSNSCALLEVSPETGVKHQIRTHLLHVLNTPILGDHKYSYLTEIKPQILPSDVIRRLGIRQTKARNLPMYIHAKELIIPHLLDGRTFSVHCSVPRAFRSFLKKAKISHKKGQKNDHVRSDSVKREL